MFKTASHFIHPQNTFSTAAPAQGTRPGLQYREYGLRDRDRDRDRERDRLQKRENILDRRIGWPFLPETWPFSKSNVSLQV